MTEPIRTKVRLSLRRPLLVLFLTLVFAAVPLAPGKADDDVAQDCIDQLGDPDVDIIACTVPFQLKRRAREDLMRITGGVLRDAVCLVEVGLERAAVFNALVHARDLDVPAQPVACDVVTDRQPLQARFTLAPRVRFADGKAVGASPGLGNVTGVSPLLAILLTNWVNNNPQVQRAMVAWVNDYMSNGVR